MDISDSDLRTFISKMASDSELQALIATVQRDYKSVDDLKSNAPGVAELLEKSQMQFRAKLLAKCFSLATEGLIGERWYELAQRPKEFNKQLDKYLHSIRYLMKLIYGIPAHRTRSQAVRDRDRDLWLMKTAKPNLTFGQLAKAFKMKSGAAELAYKRQAVREKARIADYIKGLIEFIRVIEPHIQTATEPQQASVAKSSGLTSTT